MAYDRYRDHPSSEDPPPFFGYSDPRMQYPAGYTPAEAETSRSRASSSVRNNQDKMPNTSRYHQPQQPIREAVSSAVNHVENPNHISPEVITQITESITESVLKQLKTSGLDAGTPLPPTQQ
ncbi:hypothetical protein MMC08_002392, partial [Hypocenomyce scalaris]|nr:hypothetical protein [Hypocenomyce scalaris]